jgi:hypothetical protein
MWKDILANIRPEPPNASLALKGLDQKLESLPPLKHYEQPQFATWFIRWLLNWLVVRSMSIKHIESFFRILLIC